MKKRITALLLGLFFTVAMLAPVSAFAAGEETYVLTIRYNHPNSKKGGLEGVEFLVYHVAEPDENGGYRLTGDFTRYSVSLDDLDSDTLSALADTLAAYAARDKLFPAGSCVTDAEGVGRVEGLAAGMYLVVGSARQEDSIRYLPKAVLVFLPGEDGENETVMHPKPGLETLDELHVIKVWRDGNGENRPQEITVQLLCDGEVFDEVVLNEENNWRYVWEDLFAAHTWQIVEKEVPEDYTVTVQQNGVIFTVTNTREQPPEEDEHLPQTGQLWWPVLALVAAGAVMLAVGTLLRRQEGPKE